MRKLLVKLVAAETALLGWLTYWLFLVYVNNPGVSQELSTELSRFPQISYTTIDISIIVIITIFSILLAVKFDRGLRPGMKLERALQMLENLMKRNLFLESQLAEIRGDKLPISGLGQQPQQVPLPTPPASSITADDSSQSGSWEKAFRTPIEAGPPNAKLPLSPPSPSPTSRLGPLDSGPREVRSVPVGPVARDEKAKPKLVASSSWEDSPARALETRGIIVPTQPPSRKTPLLTPPAITASSPSTTRLPYIPAPAPKNPTPPSVITIATSRPAPVQSLPKPGLPAQARPAGKSPSSFSTAPAVPGRASGSLQPLTTLTPINSLLSPAKPAVEPAVPATQKQSPRAAHVSETSDDDDSEDLDSAEGKDDDEITAVSVKKPETNRKEKISLFDEDSD